MVFVLRCFLLLTGSVLLHFAAADSASSRPRDPLLLRAARGEYVERTPVWLMRQAGRHMQAYRDLCEKYPTFRERSEISEVAAEISLQPWRAYGVDGVILFSDILTPLPAMGVNFDITETGKITIHPIQTRSDFDEVLNHPFEPEKSCSFVADAIAAIQSKLADEAKDTDCPARLGFIGCPFTICTYLVEGQTGTGNNFQATRKMIKENPTLLKDILEMLTERLSKYAKYQVESGAELIQLFDSWAGWLTRDEFLVWAFPYQKKVVSKIRQELADRDVPLILYMAPLEESKNGAFLELMAATGASVISVDHTVDLEAARCQLDNAGWNTTILQGNLDPIILRDGPEERIRDETSKILKAAQTAVSETSDETTLTTRQPFRRHIMNLGHGIHKDTPEEHVTTFIQTVKTFIP